MDWIDKFFDEREDYFQDACEQFAKELRAAHAAHCTPLTNELVERIAAAVIEDCQQAQRVGFTATSVRTWLPTAWNIKQIILRVRDGEAKGESDG